MDIPESQTRRAGCPGFEPLMVYQLETEYQKDTLFFRVKTVRGSNPTFTSFTPTHFVRCCPFCLTNRLTALRPERRKGMSLRWRLIVRARLSRAQDGRHEVAVKTPDGVPTENTCFGWEKWEKGGNILGKIRYIM